MNEELFAPGFLVAAPTLVDPNFNETVVLMFHHDIGGAMGVVVNRPIELRLKDLVGALDVEIEDASHLEGRVFLGGPVAPQTVWILHSPDQRVDESLEVSEDLLLSASPVIFEQILNGKPPERYRIYLGYSGWGPGQLEHEIDYGSWVTSPLDMGLLFEVAPEDQWRAVYDAMGIDPAMWTTPIGEA